MTKTHQEFSKLDFLILAVVGALSGLLLYLLFLDFEGQLIEDGQKLQAATFIIAFSAGFYLLWRRQNMFARLGVITFIATIIAGFTWINSANSTSENDATMLFWVLIGGPLLGFLLSAFARASFRENSLFWPYRALWQSGSSILADMLIAVAVGGAAIAFVLLWSFAFNAFGMEAASDVTHHALFLLPLGGAAAALAAGLARSNARLGETVRSILLIGCRIGLPLAALFSVAFTIGLISGGSTTLEKAPLTPAGLLLALALASELIFNGVYQDGAKTPPSWLRFSSWIALAILPVFTLTATFALWMRIGDYGLTPPRMIALIALTLTAAYTILLLAGLLSELAKNNESWMPPVAKLNTLMAGVWVLTLVLMHTPLLDPTGVSARNQMGRLLSGKVSPEAFDYGFLRFKLGRAGERAFTALEQSDDPKILAAMVSAQNADDYWTYKTAKKEGTEIAPDPEVEKEPDAFAAINAILAPMNMQMQDAASFDYGALVHTSEENSKDVLNALTEWARQTNADDSGPVQILRELVGQGIIAARQTRSLEEWEAASAAANGFREDFEDQVETNFKAMRLNAIAAKDRRARALFETQSKNQNDMPLAQALLELLQANAVIDAMDKEHLEIVKGLLGARQWLDPDEIGKAAEHDAWLIVMHGNHDPAFQEKVLGILEPRALAGEFDGRRYARLYDQVALARGEPQRYGTKTVCENGNWVADITEDPDNLDARRAEMGLGPLVQALMQERARFGTCNP